MRACEVVLCIQDTLELNFSGQMIAGMGLLSYETQSGMYVHPTYAVITQCEPLGMLDAWMWARDLGTLPIGLSARVPIASCMIEAKWDQTT